MESEKLSAILTNEQQESLAYICKRVLDIGHGRVYIIIKNHKPRIIGAEVERTFEPDRKVKVI
jgi:hypothetical protein